jgi:hypothetical protein
MAFPVCECGSVPVARRLIARGDGGDNFVVLREGTNRLGGEVDLDALVTYFGSSSPVAPGPRNRITRLN